jgi:hypothetical protein
VLCTGCIAELDVSSWIDGLMLWVSYMWEKVVSII